MSAEPIYIRQTGEPMTQDERTAWIRAAAKEAREAGCVLVRASVDDAAAPTITLVEGWLTHVADQGEPRFQMQAY